MSADLVSRGGRTFRFSTFDDGLHTRPVYRGGDGPPVILIHELGGLDPTTLDVTDRLCEKGFRVVMPLLVGDAGPEIGRGAAIVNWIRICISREIHVFLTGRTSPVATWLRALAKAEKGADRGVGIIGMCFSGGFALAAAVDDSVVAAIASQPALPWPTLPGTGRDLGLSRDDLVCVRQRYAAGSFGVRAFRYRDDKRSPHERMETYRTEFGTDVVMEPMGTAHSLLARASHPTNPDPLAVPALTATIELLTARLLVP